MCIHVAHSHIVFFVGLLAVPLEDMNFEDAPPFLLSVGALSEHKVTDRKAREYYDTDLQ